MPQWVFKLPSCGKVFRHSEIERSSENLLYDALWPYRPGRRGRFEIEVSRLPKTRNVPSLSIDVQLR